jgi:predicted aconitase with swiveling domain
VEKVLVIKPRISFCGEVAFKRQCLISEDHDLAMCATTVDITTNKYIRKVVTLYI